MRCGHRSAAHGTVAVAWNRGDDVHAGSRYLRLDGQVGHGPSRTEFGERPRIVGCSDSDRLRREPGRSDSAERWSRVARCDDYDEAGSDGLGDAHAPWLVHLPAASEAHADNIRVVPRVTVAVGVHRGLDAENHIAHAARAGSAKHLVGEYRCIGCDPFYTAAGRYAACDLRPVAVVIHRGRG